MNLKIYIEWNPEYIGIDWNSDYINFFVHVSLCNDSKVNMYLYLKLLIYWMNLEYMEWSSEYIEWNPKCIEYTLNILNEP